MTSASATHEPIQPEVPEAWRAQERLKRELPRPAKQILATVGGLLLLVVVIGQWTKTSYTEKIPSALPAGFEEDITTREEYTADHFRRATGYRSSEPTEFDLAERKRLRENNPEDLIQHRKTTAKRQPSEAATTPKRLRPRELFYRPKSIPSAEAATAVQSVSAGSLIAVKLRDPLTITNRTSTAIATVTKNKPLPLGTRLIGNARRAGDARVTIHFRSAVFPDGREVRLDGEARAPSGDSVLLASTSRSKTNPRGASRVAQSRTGKRILDTALSRTPLVGALARDVLDETLSPTTTSTVAKPTLSLPAGTEFSVLLRRGLALSSPQSSHAPNDL